MGAVGMTLSAVPVDGDAVARVSPSVTWWRGSASSSARRSGSSRVAAACGIAGVTALGLALYPRETVAVLVGVVALAAYGAACWSRGRG